MIWLSDRYGSHGDDGNEGDPEYDVYETFFTKEALTRFRLSPAEYEVLKANEDKAKKKTEEDKSGETKGSVTSDQTGNQPPKPVAMDLNRIEDRTARLTLASNRIVCHALGQDGEQLVYLAKSGKGFEVWLLKPRIKELRRLGEIEAEERPFGQLPQQLLLNFKAGKPTALTVFDPVHNNRFVVTTKPIALQELEALLYKRWVKQRREMVDKLSNGTIGYVHVARMEDRAYRDMFSEALGRQVDKKALIVDTRWNPGGNMHDPLATFLAGKKYFKWVPRGQVLGWEPGRKWSEPTVLLANEGNYSDCLVFPWLYKHLQLGPFIGMPVSDSGSFVWWETLEDPTLVLGIPEVGLQDEQGDFLEKAEVKPDIEVMNDPKSTAEGRDLQLERAVSELMKGT
jgi:hypothetical protein